MARRRKTEEQMDLLEEGGLKDEGGTVDPVSGNDVPPGSTQEEVRDDIPAQLSEGEFVFPADVTRYIGLENLMELRQKAKMGLQKMEDMGQMGNSEEATMSDNGDFEDSIDKTIEALPMAMGGMVPTSAQPMGAQVLGPPSGNTMPGQRAPMPTTSAFQMQPSTAMNQTANPNLTMAQGGMVPTVEQEMMQKGRQAFARGGSVMPVEQEMMQKSRQNFQVGGMPQPVPTVTSPTQVPTYAQFMGQSSGQGPASPVVYGTDQYIGPNGDIIGITTINGQPVQDVPAGYKKYNPATDMPAQPKVGQPEVVQRDGGGGGRDDARDETGTTPDLGMSTQDIQDALASVNEDLAKALENRPKGIMEVLARGLTGNLFSALRTGYYTNQAANQVRAGENLSTAPTGEYKSFRENMSLPTAASVAQSEMEARNAVESGDIQGTSFGSRSEAEAVANDGWGSDAHFDAIDDQFGGLSETRGGGGSESSSSSGGRGGAGRDAGMSGPSAGDPGSGSSGSGSSGGASSGGQTSGGAETAGGDQDFNKGGAVKPKRKKGLGRLK